MTAHDKSDYETGPPEKLVERGAEKRPSEARVVATLGAASFMNDMGSDIVFSIWPIFVMMLGGNPLILGFIDGLGDLVVNISKGLSGFASDRVKRRKPFIWAGYAAGGISRIAYGLSPSWEWLVPSRILDRAGKIRGAPRDALLADASSMYTRGRNFGILRAMDNLGAVVGISITILFVILGLHLVLGLQVLFIAAAIPSLIGAVLVALLVPEFRAVGEKGKGKASHFAISGVSKSLVIFMALSVLFTLASFSFSLVTFYAGQFFPDLALGVPISYLVGTVAAALLSAPIGKLGDVAGRRIALLTGFGAFAVMCLLFLATPSLPLILAGLVCYGASQAAVQPLQRTIVSELAPTDLRASILGLYQMIVGFAALPASIIAGLLWTLFGGQAPFLLALILTLAAALLLPLVKETKTSEETEA